MNFLDPCSSWEKYKNVWKKKKITSCAFLGGNNRVWLCCKWQELDGTKWWRKNEGERPTKTGKWLNDGAAVVRGERVRWGGKYARGRGERVQREREEEEEESGEWVGRVCLLFSSSGRNARNAPRRALISIRAPCALQERDSPRGRSGAKLTHSCKRGGNASRSASDWELICHLERLWRTKSARAYLVFFIFYFIFLGVHFSGSEFSSSCLKLDYQLSNEWKGLQGRSPCACVSLRLRGESPFHGRVGPPGKKKLQKNPSLPPCSRGCSCSELRGL